MVGPLRENWIFLLKKNLDSFYISSYHTFLKHFFSVLGRPEATVNTKIYLLGFPDGALRWELVKSQNQKEEFLKIHLPSMAKMQHVQNAWALKLTKIK